LRVNPQFLHKKGRAIRKRVTGKPTIPKKKEVMVEGKGINDL